MESLPRVHLFTTDKLVLELIKISPSLCEPVCFVFPENRIKSEKVREFIEILDAPWVVHNRDDPKSVIDHAPPATYAISFMYSQIICSELLEYYDGGGLNFHGGRIPEYRGANVLNWALAAGEKTLWATWHELAISLDSGGIYGESAVDVKPEDTAEICRSNLALKAIDIFPSAWKKFFEKQPPIRVPNLEEGKLWPSRRAKDGFIGENWTRQSIVSMILAQSSHRFPPAWIYFQGCKYSVFGLSEHHNPNTIPYVTAEGIKVWLEVEIYSW